MRRNSVVDLYPGWFDEQFAVHACSVLYMSAVRCACLQYTPLPGLSLQGGMLQQPAPAGQPATIFLPPHSALPPPLVVARQDYCPLTATFPLGPPARLPARRPCAHLPRPQRASARPPTPCHNSTPWPACIPPCVPQPAPPACSYGVDNDTAGEIRSVSFRQVVRDLQVCAVQPIRGACEWGAVWVGPGCV